MPNNEIIFGTGGIRPLPKGVSGPLALDSLSGLMVSQLLPPYALLAASGALYAIDMSAGTPVTPVIAAPVASPQWGLYNNSATLSMIVLRASSTLVSGTAGLGAGLMGTTAIGAQTAVTADYAGTIKSCLNGDGSSPPVFLDDNPTLIGGTPAWFAFNGTKVNSIAIVSVGDAIVANVDGMIVAPPNGHMAAFELVGLQGTSALWDFQAIIAMVDLR